MFELSLVEISPETRKRKRWIAIVSYLMEALAVGVLLAFPLLHTEALPLDDHPTMHPPMHYVPPHVDVVAVQEHSQTSAKPAPINVFQQPSRIPTTVDRTPDPPSPYSAETNDGIPTGAIPVADPREQNPTLESLLKPPPVKPVMHAALPRISTSMESMLIRQVKPVYPSIAIASRVEGTVVLGAVINRQGEIEQVHLISGHPLLVRAALEAVKQWRYRPYLLNGEAVEVDTQITVNFTLSSN